MEESSPKKLFLINGCILFSLLSKDSGIITIPITALFLFIFFRQKFKTFCLSTLLTLLIYAMLRFVIAKIPLFNTPNMIVPIAQANLLQRLETIPYELFTYLRIVFFPKDLFVQQHFVVKSLADPKFFIVLPVVLIIFAALVIGFFIFKSKTYNFFLLWTFISMSIILNLYPLDLTLLNDGCTVGS